jgi:hypothetical protein
VLMPSELDRLDARLITRGRRSTVALWQSFLQECELRYQPQLAPIERDQSFV